jgi:capsular polysaccharide export protein
VLSLVTTTTTPCRSASPPAAILPVACNPALERLARSRRVLLLQGPVGPFFDRLTHWLHGQGAQVHRVAFHTGDQWDCRAMEPIRFLGRPDEWPEAFTRLLESHRIDCVALFGQARPHHATALAMARPAGIPVVVFEEGYVRPGFATMELDGVNGHSTTLDRYRWCSGPYGEPVWPPTDAAGRLQWRMALHAMRHYLPLCSLPPLNPHHVHHRSTHMRHHLAHWLRTAWGGGG